MTAVAAALSTLVPRKWRLLRSIAETFPRVSGASVFSTGSESPCFAPRVISASRVIAKPPQVPSVYGNITALKNLPC